MTRVCLPAGMVATIALLAACGAPTVYSAQHDEELFQATVARIDRPFARPATGLGTDERRLQTAIAAYRRLRPPVKLDALQRKLVAGLAGELRSYRDAERAQDAGNAGALHQAEALGARSRSAVALSLRRLQAAVGRCRDDVDRC